MCYICAVVLVFMCVHDLLVPRMNYLLNWQTESSSLQRVSLFSSCLHGKGPVYIMSSPLNKSHFYYNTPYSNSSSSDTKVMAGSCDRHSLTVLSALLEEPSWSSHFGQAYRQTWAFLCLSISAAPSFRVSVFLLSRQSHNKLALRLIRERFQLLIGPQKVSSKYPVIFLQVHPSSFWQETLLGRELRKNLASILLDQPRSTKQGSPPRTGFQSALWESQVQLE